MRHLLIIDNGVDTENYYFNNKKEAIKEYKRLINAGITCYIYLYIIEKII